MVHKNCSIVVLFPSLCTSRMNLFLFFLFQSLQAVTTRRNCQLDNAEESLHVITTGIIIGILPKRLIAPPTDFC